MLVLLSEFNPSFFLKSFFFKDTEVSSKTLYIRYKGVVKTLYKRYKIVVKTLYII